MNKIVAFIIALACIPAWGDPRIDNMFGQCQQVMTQGACFVALDTRNFPANGTTLISGYGPVSNATYLYFRDPGFTKRDATTYEMCARIKDACEANFDGPGCHVARSRWRQY